MKRKERDTPNEPEDPIDEMTMLRKVVPFEPTKLAETNPHELDDTITFDESIHKYTIRVGDEWISEGIKSASTMIHEFFPQFDPDKVIENMRRNVHKFNSSKYAGMSDEEIKKLWNGNTASERGTYLHFLLECHNNGFDLEHSEYNALSDIQDYFRWHVIHMTDQIPFRTELKMHTGKDLRLAGTADLITIDKDHPPPCDTDGTLSVHLKDWKFSKEIKRSNHFEKGFGVCKHLDNCNFNHYALQQNLYQWMLETFYGGWKWNGHIYKKVKVVSKYLVVFHKNHSRSGAYIPVPDMMDTIESMLDVRRAYVRNKYGNMNETSE